MRILFVLKIQHDKGKTAHARDNTWYSLTYLGVLCNLNHMIMNKGTTDDDDDDDDDDHSLPPYTPPLTARLLTRIPWLSPGVFHSVP